jgi:penicillin-binding protein 2
MIETFRFTTNGRASICRTKSQPDAEELEADHRETRSKWSDIRTVYASIGQDTVVVTPISMLRAVSSIGVKGRMYVPHFLKEFKPIGAIGQETDSTYIPARQGFGFQRPEPKMIPMTPEQEGIMVKGMWGVVNDAGTAARIRIPGFDIAGKTGTAQVASLGKDVGANKDHAWFVSFAPAYKPEIAVIALVENVGFGGSFAAPAARGVYDVYLAKKGFAPAAEQKTDKGLAVD